MSLDHYMESVDQTVSFCSGFQKKPSSRYKHFKRPLAYLSFSHREHGGMLIAAGFFIDTPRGRRKLCYAA